jgi:hypothetical protein
MMCLMEHVQSRIAGGIHGQYANVASLEIGDMIGHLVFARYDRPLVQAHVPRSMAPVHLTCPSCTASSPSRVLFRVPQSSLLRCCALLDNQATVIHLPKTQSYAKLARARTSGV